MAISITKIDDKSDGFTVEFTVINTYKQRFPARPISEDQMLYARSCVQGIVSSPVEKPEGVLVRSVPVTGTIGEDTVTDLTSALPAPAPPEL